MVIDVLVLAASLLILGIGILNALTARRFEGLGDSEVASSPFLSVLIPARDEEENLRQHLPGLLESRYSSFEVRVLDDGSGDGTRALVESLRQRYPDRLFIHEGAPLPTGWLGKNWACHQLSAEARGELLIFCDADVAIGKAALARTASCFLDERIAAFSALPRQRMETLAERAIIPFMMQISVLGLLPLRLAERAKNPELVSATGQWLVFRRWAYFAIGGHASVRGSSMEDMDLAKRVKAAQIGRVATAIANEDLAIRMYRNAHEVREGFAKNAYLLFGGHPVLMVAYLAFHVSAYVAPWIGFGWPYALTMLVAFRTIGALVFRDSWKAAFAHPVGAVLFPFLVVDSYRRHNSGQIAWKGRFLPAAKPSRV